MRTFNPSEDQRKTYFYIPPSDKAILSSRQQGLVEVHKEHSVYAALEAAERLHHVLRLFAYIVCYVKEPDAWGSADTSE